MTTHAPVGYANLKIEVRETVCVVTVHRPEVLNALNRATLIEIDLAVQAFVSDDACRAMILTGAGEKSFVAGADINELAGLDARGAAEASAFGQRVFDRIANSRKPVIAAVNGFAFGGGCELALACHARMASDNAVFGLPEVGLGIIPGYGGTQRLPRLVGLGRAIDITLSGRRVRADEAERIGLVSAVGPCAGLVDRALEMARSITRHGPLAVAAALEVMLEGSALPIADGQRMESAHFGLLAASEDMHEGMKAFLEKRPPVFRGR